jgi:hypothetical protein
MFTSIVEVTQKSCQALESIQITVDVPGPSILVRGAFLGGSAPHLRTIKLDGIAFPFSSVKQVLLSTNNLVELHLAKIPDDAYFSPNDLVTTLSTLAQLKRLTVDYHSPASSPPPIMTRPPPQRITLPSLHSLEFYGVSAYLEEFVARIDSPALCKIAIRLFNDICFEIPQFCEFIARLDVLKSPTWALVRHSAEFVGILFFQEGKPLSENCFLGTSCRQLDWQLSFVTQISSQLSPHLSSVHSLGIQSDYSPHLSRLNWAGLEDVQWLELFQPFTHVTKVYVRVNQFVQSITQALVAEEMTAEVLPELTSLFLSGCDRWSSYAKNARQFVATRELSGHTVSLFY